MRKQLLIIAISLLGCALPSLAQLSNDNEDGVNKIKRNAPRYKEGEIIVKFKNAENITVRSNSKGNYIASSTNSLQKRLNTISAFEMEQLMPLTGNKVSANNSKALFSNRTITDTDLSKLCVVRFDKNRITTEEALERIKTWEDVEYAEPNALAFICAQDDGTPAFDDPLYSQQWGLSAINIPKLWPLPKLDLHRPVIAILDTGVDINHPDLAANIWTNQLEADGQEFSDDDANGYYDDLHGWDFVNNMPIINDGMDRNGHGTHCAGIAAACGNNGIGIVGANPDAFILPIKVMADNGTGDIATIIRGIDYAIACEVNVLSMSIGGYAPSMKAVEDALKKAYARYIITVGAAGNNGVDINEDNEKDLSPSAPGCFDFVIGVMASNESGNIASFSNYDSDGPFYSAYQNLWNYEVKAPGTNILSTYPGGKYKSLSGTSMATPLVAGALSIIQQIKGFELAHDYGIYGDVIQSTNSNGVFDAYKVSTWNEDNRDAVLKLLSIRVDDSVSGDGDGQFDAGETIELYPTIRSLWGQARNIKIRCSIDNENILEDAISFINNEADFGYTLNSQGYNESANPIRIKVGNNVNDAYNLILTFSIICDGMSSEQQNMTQDVSYSISNVTEITGLIGSNTELTSDKNYIFSGTIGVPKDVTFIIGENVKIKLATDVIIECYGHIGIKDGVEISGNNKLWIYSYNEEYSIKGKPQNRVIIDCPDLYFSNARIEYADIHSNKTITANSARFCTFYTDTNINDIENCNIINGFNGIYGTKYVSNEKNNFLRYDNAEIRITRHSYSGTVSMQDNSNYIGARLEYNLSLSDNPEDYPVFKIYPGTSSKKILDQSLTYNWYYPNTSQLLSTPVAEAPGMVWKVVVDGYDAQDEYDILPPLGLGTHKFDVYFNRPMLKAFHPSITMGLKEPYNQTFISDASSWNDDGTVYTAYLNITGRSKTDGVNRIVIKNAKDENYMTIPIEDIRFKVNVQAVGSMATGLMAEAGLGKVKLTWETNEEDFADLLGYNVYRYNDREETYTEYGRNDEGKLGYWQKTRIVRDTKMVNTSLLDASETELIDYDVVPGTTYYYMVKEMGTDLQEHDVSNVVAATPLTAQKGDANGSMSVDVADVVTEVAYLTNQDPQPFIFEAADVNEDETVNILDVVGTVNIIMTPSGAGTASTDNTATYTVEDNILYVDATTPLGGIQVNIIAEKDTDIEMLDGLNGMEQTSAWITDNEYMLLAYSMSGKAIGTGKQPLMRIGSAEVKNLVASDAKGHNVLAIGGSVTKIETLPFGIDNFTGAEVRYYDLTGTQISKSMAEKNGVHIQSIFLNGKCVKSYKMIK